MSSTLPIEDFLSATVPTLEEVTMVPGRDPEGSRESRSFLDYSANRNSRSQYVIRFEIFSHGKHNNYAAHLSAIKIHQVLHPWGEFLWTKILILLEIDRNTRKLEKSFTIAKVMIATMSKPHLNNLQISFSQDFQIDKLNILILMSHNHQFLHSETFLDCRKKNFAWMY